MTIPSGYRYRPSRYSPSLGHAGLELDLTDKPGPTNFFIRTATFRVASSRIVDHTFYDLRTQNGARQDVRVVAGNLHLVACNHDVLYGFSFGGRLGIEDHGDYTTCCLESSAPIFELVEEWDATPIFVFSVLLGQLARQRAAWMDDDIGFEHRLVNVDPFQFFTAGLAFLDDYLARFYRWGEEYRAGLRWVRRAIDILSSTGEWPASPPVLQELI